MKAIAIKVLISIIFISGAVFVGSPAYAVFELRADSSILDFGLMSIAESKKLQERGTYHNEVTCLSDTDAVWYLKVHLVEPLSSGAAYIPNENFEWRATEAVGGSGMLYNQDKFMSFSDMPGLVYTGVSTDSEGTAVRVRFDYRLSIPKDQLPGNYRSTVRYTMTELL